MWTDQQNSSLDVMAKPKNQKKQPKNPPENPTEIALATKYVEWSIDSPVINLGNHSLLIFMQHLSILDITNYTKLKKNLQCW